MRGEASRIADRVSRDSLAPKLRDSGEDAWRIGNELFTITSALDHNIQLERALTDPSRPVEDKVAVVKTLIGDQAHPLVMEIMSDLVSRRWSRVSDIANAVEDFGVDGMMYYADYTNTTLQVSIELAELHSALLNLPVVRTKLYDATVSSEARVKLLYSLIGDADFTKVTKRLAEHATCNLRNRRYLQTIQWLILPPYGRIDGHCYHGNVVEQGAGGKAHRHLLGEDRSSGAHQLGGRSDRHGWHAHPGGRRGHRQHGGRTAAASSAHGEGNRLTVRRTVNKPETRLD